MRSLLLAAVAATLTAVSVCFPAMGGFIPEVSEISYSITHDSGFLDGEEQSISASFSSADRWGGPTPFGPAGPPLYFFDSSLYDDDTPGASNADAAIWARGYPGSPYVFTAPHMMTSVTQNNPAAPSAGPASVRMEYDGWIQWVDDGTPDPLNRVMMYIAGIVGSGDGAYIQFEARQTMTALDADRNVLDSYTVGIGGSDPIIIGYLDGGGRIDHLVMPGGGVIPSFRVGNYPPYPTPFGFPGTYTGPPVFNLPAETTFIQVAGFYEIQAKNEGSPSGIFLSESPIVLVPEPGTFLLLGLCALFPRRRFASARN